MSTNKSEHPQQTHRSLVKAAGVIGLATLCSRLLGFIRDIVIARMFGVYIYAQAFVVAFKIPNLFRDLVGEGASNAAFIPVFSEYLVKHRREEFWELANVVLNLLLVVLMVITVLGVLFSGIIVRIIAPGFIAAPDKLDATIRLTRIIFPYILLISLTAYAVGILNSLKHFIAPAFAPCLLNISIIIFALIFGESITGLALGVLIGGLLQLAVQIPVLYKKGFRLKPPRSLRHPAAKQIGLLMVPRLASSSIYQLNNFLDSIFGSLARVVGEGGVAILYFAYRLIMFPLGVFSNSLTQAILPTFSRQALEENYDNLRRTLSFGLRIIFFVMLPASIGFIVLSRPIISNLFEGGKFNHATALITADVLSFYSIGLFAFGATKILQCCFFALKDTLTPTKLAGLALLMNMVLNACLMFPLKLSGLALATSLSGINTFLILFFLLKKRLAPFDLAPILLSFLRIFLASVAMGLVCYFVSGNIALSATRPLYRINNLIIPILAGVLSYIFFCFIFKVPEMQELRIWMARRKKGEG